MMEILSHDACTMLQGPLGWQSFSGLPVGDSLLDREIDFYIHADEHAVISSISWEATIQKQIQEELFDSSIEVTASSIDEHAEISSMPDNSLVFFSFLTCLCHELSF